MAYTKKGRPPDPYAGRKVEAVRLARTGEYLRREIAAALGVSEDSVSRWCGAAGVGEFRNGRKKRLAVRMAMAGHTITAIVQATGATRRYILGLNRELNLGCDFGRERRQHLSRTGCTI